MKRILKDIFHILNTDEKRKLWILSVSDVILSILDIGFLVVLLYAINFYTRPASASTSGLFMLPLISEHPLAFMLVFFLLFALKNVFGLIISGSQYHFVYGVASRISRDGLMQYLRGSYPDFVHIDSSVVNRKISQQPIEFCHYVLNGMQQIFSQVVLVMITSIAVLIYNPVLFPLLILFLVPPVLLITFLMKRKLNNATQQGKQVGEKAIQHLQEALSGYVESNTYKKNEFFTNRYYRFQAELNRYLSTRLAIQSMPGRLIEVFVIFGLLVLVLVNSLIAHDHGFGIVTIGALMIAVYKIIPGIVKITNTSHQVKSYAFSTSGLSTTPAENPDAIHQDNSIESLKFDHIYFSYQHKPVLRDFSMEIFKGEMMGITGISGKGKTTLINLLLGFLPADSGSIYINGQVADPGNRKLYWNRIAYGKQQHFFLHDTIAKNITLQDGRHDREKLKKVISIAGIDKIISGFPLGVDTMITENGKNFSGGQRQRFLFARALYKDADLLILDEPFSELDEWAETDMLKQLQKIAAEGRIVLLITHNIKALNYCNRKCLMDEQG